MICGVHALHPEGIDGLCCNAGVFGAANLAHGLFGLPNKRSQSCVVTSSNIISQGAARTDLVDMLNYSQTKPVKEERILAIAHQFDDTNLTTGNSFYVTTKYPLARWVRRTPAS